MPSVCMYFQVHQPFRLSKYSIFDAQHEQNYFDEEKNKQILLKVAEKCYLPTNRLLLELIRKYHGKFRIAFSISGTAIEQFSKYAPEVLAGFRALALTGCVEFLAETYSHSLSSAFSTEEFIAQVKKHHDLMLDNFDYAPKTFRNTELLYRNDIAKIVEKLGYKTILTEGADQVLGWRSPNYLYKAAGANVNLLMRNYKLSDDIAFRFSNKSWAEYPLTAGKYASWICKLKGNADVVNLFMDYETFGEHHWKDSGIFSFLQHLPKEVIDCGADFILPSEASSKCSSKGELSVESWISWADSAKDISAWLGNNMQNDSAIGLFKLEKEVKALGGKALDDWRKLTSADHLYYISTKHLSDGEVHRYFSPYRSPYDAFINFMNVLENMRKRVAENKGKKTAKPKAKKSLTSLPQKKYKVTKPKSKPKAVSRPKTKKTVAKAKVKAKSKK